MKSKLAYLRNASRFDDAKFILGEAEPDWEDSDFEDFEREISLDSLRKVIDEIMAGVPDGESINSTKSNDARFSRTLRETLDITRREASDPDLWAFMTCCFAPDYVRWRFNYLSATNQEPKLDQRARFMGGIVGPKLRNIMRTMWWASEFTYTLDEEYIGYFLKNQNFAQQFIQNNMMKVPTICKAVLDAIFKNWDGDGKNMPGVGGKRDDYGRTFMRTLNQRGSTFVFEALTPEEAAELVKRIKEDLDLTFSAGG